MIRELLTVQLLSTRTSRPPVESGDHLSTRNETMNGRAMWFTAGRRGSRCHDS